MKDMETKEEHYSVGRATKWACRDTSTLILVFFLDLNHSTVQKLVSSRASIQVWTNVSHRRRAVKPDIGRG